MTLSELGRIVARDAAVILGYWLGFACVNWYGPIR